MWIPVILIAWSFQGPPMWVNFPMVNFPFQSEVECKKYVKTVREQVMKSDNYIAGYSICIEVPQKKGQPTGFLNG